MIGRRTVVLGGLGLTGLGLLAGCAPAKVARVGVLTGSSPNAPRQRPWTEAFKAGLRALGYVEGQNVIIEWRGADEQLERLPALAAELVRLPVDVIVTHDSSIAPAMQATSTVPIVFASSAAPVETGQIASYARPGGNVTGLADSGPEVTGKRVELLREMLPGLRRVGILGPPQYAATIILFRETEAAVRALGLDVLRLEVPTPESIEGAFAAATRESAEAVVVLRAPVTNPNAARIVALAAQHRLPAIYGDRLYSDVGGLATYATNHPELWRRAAGYVDRILKGATTADLPVERPTTFELILNVPAARTIGLTIPQTVVGQATEVLE